MRTPFVVPDQTLGPDAAPGADARVILHNVQIAMHEWSTADAYSARHALPE